MTIRLLFLLHIGIVIAFYLINGRWENKLQNLCESSMVLLLPFFGCLIILGAKMILRMTNGGAEYEKPVKHQRTMLSGIMQPTADIVSLNDASLVEDAEEKRYLFTNAIKQNLIHNQAIVHQAIRDDDREVSHYAVSMVTTQIENLEMELFKIEKQLKQVNSVEDRELLKSYIKTMREYLSIGFLDPISRRHREEVYCMALARLIELRVDEKDSYKEMIHQEICLGNYGKVKVDCKNFLQTFPRAEEPYLAYIQLFIKTRNHEGLQKKIEELKACPIKLTISALEIIRFWDKGAGNV